MGECTWHVSSLSPLNSIGIWLEYSSAHNPVRLYAVPGFDECVVRFTTDVPYLSEWGKPLLLGPGSILDAHTDHERISRNELAGAVSLYTTIARQLRPQMNTD